MKAASTSCNNCRMTMWNYESVFGNCIECHIKLLKFRDYFENLRYNLESKKKANNDKETTPISKQS